MLIDHWPLLGLRLTTPRLELRLPTDEELGSLAELVVEPIHEPDRMPFTVPWTDRPPAERARSVVQHHWLRRGSWAPDNWQLNLAVFRDGEVLGLQTLAARDFATVREVNSGSWLGARHQGQGVGTEMRAAVLHLAFAGLGAEEAVSSAFESSTASRAVSAKLGYEPDGLERYLVRGERLTSERLRLSRERWQAHRGVPVTVTGLAPCLDLFGLPAASGA
ncbi:GNAT family N-acetyltransferase [Kitasatospora sp. NBC_01287]|uniref:GNAT family N-acetyltransferase n=1 Tax=Kitasatospora sp. NBC_01287 TaxID=2903573 RepID=UPI0022509AF6|nr:GNAT family N-acetyltransferase [Kitasatospora sp. NBC_01287]MCX4748684.1 GNAT family N-acetyltransferase [Kitasatospora sp. NBC_01287]